MNQTNAIETTAASSAPTAPRALPTGEAMEDLMATLFNNFNPYVAASDSFYYPLEKARGSVSLADTVASRLRFLKRSAMLGGNGTKGYLRILFTGHIGGGKSSELLHLEKRLRLSGSEFGGLRLLPIYVDTEDFINRTDAALPELLLGTLVTVSEFLAKFFKNVPDVKPYGDGILPDWLHRLLPWLPRIEKVELGAKIGTGAVPGGELSAKAIMSPVLLDKDVRQRVRDAIREKEDSVLAEINKVLIQARTTIGTHNLPYDDIILIVDSLEKVHRGEGRTEENLRELFIESAPTLSGIDAHTIHTLPLRVQYAFGGELQVSYGSRPFTMPMVAVEKRDRKPEESEIPYEHGYECLREMIRARLADYSEDSVFAPGALDYMIQRSGGHIRNLMIFIQDSFAKVDVLPVTMGAARQAVGPTLELYSRMVSDREYDRLAKLHRDARRHLDTNDPDARKMLEQLMVLEYRNGVDAPTTEEGAEAEPWYAVNPVVRELRGFKAAVERLDKENAKPAQS